MEDIVAGIISKRVGLKAKEVEKLIEIPPKDGLGDYAFPCFSLAKKEGKNPLVIAEDLTEKFRKNLPKEISNVNFSGGYVNFFVDKNVLAKTVLVKVSKRDFGKIKGKGRRVGLEYPSPNTNKALHVGHLRNISIGESILKILENAGENVVHLNLFNDRGILIAKSMLGYELYARNSNPKSEGVKGDKFVGDLYIKFSKASEANKDLEIVALEKLRLWEDGDKKTLELWKKLNSWAYSGIQETFDKFGLSKIDKNYYESEIYGGGKKIIENGLKKGFFKKKGGAVIINLENKGLGEKVLLRKDGTSVYITQDLFLAEQKIKDFKLDSSYYVVGSEQDYHFKVLFEILKKLGINKDFRHFSYGMIALPSGKMKSREGTAVSADNLIEETSKLAKKGIKERNSTKISKNEIEKRALVIALAAIKYNLIKVDIKRKIIFDPNKAISFEGDTGPYLLYSYARASSISRKVKSKKAVKIIDLKDAEIRLLKKIDNFPEVCLKAYENLAPNLIANYCFELSKLFNEFYHSCPVLGSIEEGFRLKLVEAFRITSKKCLNLLGIEVLEEM